MVMSFTLYRSKEKNLFRSWTHAGIRLLLCWHAVRRRIRKTKGYDGGPCVNHELPRVRNPNAGPEAAHTKTTMQQIMKATACPAAWETVSAIWVNHLF